MEASSGQGGVVTVTLTEAEAVTLHELIVFSEWSEDLLSIEVRDEAEGKVLSRLQMALRPLIPDWAPRSTGRWSLLPGPP